MVEHTSPFLAVKALETHIIGTLGALDVFSLPAPECKVVQALKNELVDTRLDIRDYELSETREEQLKKARDAKRRLEHVRALILAASEYNVFGAADVAQLAAWVEHISENVR
ncbi:MAG TPA: hypothetical protein VF261_00645 [Candidatus Saccharimonadales bacterium]